MAVQWDKRWAREILKSPAAMELVRRPAERVADAAGPGFEAWVRQGRNRARASVEAVTVDARLRNARDNTLIRALEAGRGD